MVIKIEFIPKLEVGWFNGGIFLMIQVFIQVNFILICPKEVKVRLFEQRG